MPDVFSADKTGLRALINIDSAICMTMKIDIDGPKVLLPSSFIPKLVRMLNVGNRKLQVLNGPVNCQFNAISKGWDRLCLNNAIVKLK